MLHIYQLLHQSLTAYNVWLLYFEKWCEFFGGPQLVKLAEQIRLVIDLFRDALCVPSLMDPRSLIKG